MYKLQGKHTFWILQILGWGSLSLFSITITGIAKNFTAASIVFSGSLMIGILMSSLLRWYYKKYIDLDALNLWSFVKIAFGILVVVLLSPSITYYFGYLIGYVIRFFIEDSKNYFNASRTPNSLRYFGHFIIYFGWSVLYFSIKGFRKLNKQRMARLQLRDNVKQAQLNTLKGHINPQFMFSALNNIKGLMLEDVSLSREMLTKLSEMLRYSLTKNNVNTIPLEDELEIVEHYIALSRVQYGQRLAFSMQIDANQRTTSVPPMLILNLIENTTKNGIFQIREGGKVMLKITITKGFLNLLVEHSGKIEKNESYNFGLQKIKQRLRLLYKDKTTFSLEEGSNNVLVHIVLPLEGATNDDVFSKTA
ncbi:sensor histidine kinase [Spongiimicrobium salis]|uniref:sensor histidine kinase n=1 Tax=Spongiimicrobium salis TaxID=1667022 RepID=UPI00374C9DC0